MREKTKLDKFLLKLFPRKKVEDLIKHLEDKEQLNRGNVRWCLNVRTVEHQFLKAIFIITLIVICIGFLHLIYNITFFEVCAFSDIYLSVWAMIGFPVLFFYVGWRAAEREWKFVNLMTNGNRTKGQIIKKSDRGVYHYSFNDAPSRQHKSKMKIDAIHGLEEGQQVDVAYNSDKPVQSILIGDKAFEKYNLRKKTKPRRQPLLSAHPRG